jgi:phosphorylase kinase alpha/beta subunit
VRDSSYTALAIWALGLAYRKRPSQLSTGRVFELERRAVKLMRGILTAMIRQANKVRSPSSPGVVSHRSPRSSSSSTP